MISDIDDDDNKEAFSSVLNHWTRESDCKSNHNYNDNDNNNKSYTKIGIPQDLINLIAKYYYERCNQVHATKNSYYVEATNTANVLALVAKISISNKAY